MIVRELFTLLGFKTDAAGAKAYEERIKTLKVAAAAAAAAVAAIGAAAIAATNDLIEYSSATRDAATSIGIGTEALQELSYAAKIGGASTEAMRAGLMNLGAAASGVTPRGKKVAEMLHGIGVATKDAAGKTRATEDIFTDLAGALFKIPDQGKRTAIAMRVLGDAGKALVPLFSEGPEGLAKLRQEARELGGVVSGDTVDAAEALGDELDKVTVFATGLSRTFAAGLLPVVRPLVDGFLGWAKANRQVIASNLLGFARDLGSALSVVADVGRRTASVAFSIVDSFGGVRNVIIITALGFGLLNLAMLPSILVFGAVAAGFAVIALLVADVAAYEKHGDAVDSLAGRMKKAFVDEAFSANDNTLVALMKIIAKTAAWARREVLGLVEAVSDAKLILEGASEEIMAGIVRKRLVRMTGLSGETVDAIGGAIGGGPAAVQELLMERASGLASSIVQPQVPRSNSYGVLKTVTDSRVMNFNIKSTDPKGAAMEVGQILDMNEIQVVE